jgi:hypothetical protein
MFEQSAATSCSLGHFSRKTDRATTSLSISNRQARHCICDGRKESRKPFRTERHGFLCLFLEDWRWKSTEQRIGVSGREIDQKLRLTAAVLGAVTRKDLAAAFRRINPATQFDVERANKWLQGRARPRGRQVYDDWAKLLDVGRPGQWIAECDVDAFLDALCARHDCDRNALLRQKEDAQRRREAAAGGNGAQPDLAARLAGTYVSYSHATSPYFRGRLICGELSVHATPAQPRLAATYVQNLPTGVMKIHGAVAVYRRTLSVEFIHREFDERYSMCLIRPMLPVSVIAGHFSGVTFINPETELTTTRVVLIRLPRTFSGRSGGAYLPADASLAADLAALGLPLRDPADVEQRLRAFLMHGHDRGIDQIDWNQYRALTELFDRNWLNEVASASA